MSTLERSIAFFRPHHDELRKRLVRSFIAIALCSGGAYIFAEQIALFFITPLFEASPLVYRLVYTNLPEAFLAYLKLALLVGFMVSFPYLLYQTWSFIAPGLHDNEKKLAATVVFWSSLLFLSGAAFALFSVLPRMLVYFMSYAHSGLEPLPKLGKYLTFVARTSIAFGLSFQIPFLMVMTGKAGLVKGSYFKAKRLYFYGAIVILAFLLSAGDFMAALLLSFPLFGLYEVGIFLTLMFGKKKTEPESSADASASGPIEPLDDPESHHDMAEPGTQKAGDTQDNLEEPEEEEDLEVQENMVGQEDAAVSEHPDSSKHSDAPDSLPDQAANTAESDKNSQEKQKDDGSSGPGQS